MSYIPDCRTDEYYNQKYLNEEDKAFVRGFDWCAEQAADNFFNNMYDLFGSDSYFGHFLAEKLPEDMQDEYDYELFYEDMTVHRKIETYADLFRAKLLEWIEDERDQLITSMIDNMEEEEYNAIREKGDREKGDKEGAKE